MTNVLSTIKCLLGEGECVFPSGVQRPLLYFQIVGISQNTVKETGAK